jgi:hypothetical protein
MRRAAVPAVVAVLVLSLSLLGSTLPSRSPMASQNALSLVLWLDATISTTEAMSVFVWDDGAPRDLIFKGSKTPGSPGEAFAGAVKQGFVQHLGPSDRARIGSVAKSLTLSPLLTTDHGLLNHAAGDVLNVRQADRYGPTPLWDAIDEGVTVLASEPGRRAIILVTDGMATGNTHGLDEVIQRAVAANVSVSVVCEAWLASFRSNRPSFHMIDRTGSPWTLMRSTFGKPPEANLKKLTTATGGIFVVDGEKGQIPDPGAWLPRVLAGLHH